MNKNIRKIITSTVLAAMTISVLPSNLVVFAQMVLQKTLMYTQIPN